MHCKREYDLADCTDFRQTLMARPPRFVRATMVLLIGLVAAAAAWAACTEADLVVRANGRVRPMTRSAQSPGAAAEESKVSPLRGGRVIEVHVREGDQVQQGDLLLRLETERLDKDIAKQQQLSETIENELKRLDHTEQMVRQRYEAAQAKAHAELSESEEAIQAAKERRAAAIRLAEVSVAVANDELRRLEALIKSRVVTETEFVRAQGRAREAALKLEQARVPVDQGRLAVLRHALQLVDQDHAVEQSELDAKRELKKSEAAAARLELGKLDWERQQSELRAPSDGTLTSLDVRVGDVVAPGQPVLVVVEQRGFRIDVTVTSDDVGELREGMTARVKLDAYDYQKYGSTTGRVVFVSPDSAFQAGLKTQEPPTYTVRIALDREHVGRGVRGGQIKLGMTGVAEIVTDRESILSLLFRSIRQSISLS